MISEYLHDCHNNIAANEYLYDCHNSIAIKECLVHAHLVACLFGNVTLITARTSLACKDKWIPGANSKEHPLQEILPQPQTAPHVVVFQCTFVDWMPASIQSSSECPGLCPFSPTPARNCRPLDFRLVASPLTHLPS